MAGIRQHILPRFQLKGFASRVQDKKIFTCVYRKGGPQFETTIENVGLEKHLYGKVGEISADEEITELESGYARLIDELGVSRMAHAQIVSRFRILSLILLSEPSSYAIFSRIR